METITEKLHEKAIGLDSLPPANVANLLIESQVLAAQTVQHAMPALCQGAEQIATTLRNGRTLIYAAAGSSALMIMADAMELSGTFGIDPEQVRILMAGGIPGSADMPGSTEDDISSLAKELADLQPGDTLITVSASGNTPYTLEAARLAKQRAAFVIAIANNSGTPLLAQADCAILLQTSPEVVSGSTRMGAATAQKIALNTLSTLMAIHLGHVHDGMMVNLKADNTKLKKRACQMVQTIAGVPEQQASDALSLARGNVKLASLISAGARTSQEAQILLDTEKGKLRDALQRLATSQ